MPPNYIFLTQFLCKLDGVTLLVTDSSGAIYEDTLLFKKNHTKRRYTECLKINFKKIKEIKKNQEKPIISYQKQEKLEEKQEETRRNWKKLEEIGRNGKKQEEMQRNRKKLEEMGKKKKQEETGRNR